jgi:hypothetical protein
MPDDTDERQFGGSGGVRRRGFLGSVASLFAASAFSVSVSEDVAAQVSDGDESPVQTVTSPDGSIAVTVDVTDGAVTYRVAHEGTTVVEPSQLGFEFQNQPSFGDGLVVTGSERSSTDSSWTPVWDRYDEIDERYEELRVGLREADPATPGRSLTLAIRAFDDGVGFRYVFPDASGFGDFVVTSERTAFALAGDHDSWWVQSDFNSYEYQYEQTPVSELGSASPTGGAHTPFTMATAEGRYLSVHEANLVDYASMALAPAGGEAAATTLETTLAPLPDGTKVTASAPHRTPWRTIQIADRPGGLVESNLVVNLNEERDPAEFPQGVDWIQPEKFIGVWWLMITGRADWEYTGMQSGNHGAQTGRAKQYMDFASEHGIPNVLVEGWNEGWDTYPGDGSGFDFDQSYPDFDLQAVTEYGLSLDPPVRMTMHNETAGDIDNYETQLTEEEPNPFADYDELGIRSIKTGYVADSGVSIDDTTYNHHCQPLVNHHRLVYREAAKHRQMLEIHEPVKPTGERRTYPHVMTREGVFGQEYDSFGRIDPEHHVTFPFTRMLGGPVEFTPGIFDMDSGSGGIETTRAKQLAMYAVYFSGLHMVADLPSSYLADQGATGEVGDVLQAEFGRLEGFSTRARWANAQGEQYVPVDPNTVDSGATISWTVESSRRDEFLLHLRYASDAENNAVSADTPRTASVLVDGFDQGQVTFPPTDYWDVWGTVSTTVSLSRGENVVTLELSDEDTGGFNLDSIAVTGTGFEMPDPSEAPIRGPTVDAFEFIEDVPAAGWDDTRVLDAEIGDYVVVARRAGEEWYVGAMTDEDGRALDVPLEFLGDGTYVAELYSDGIDAAYDANLTDVRIDEALVDADTTLLASAIETGGTAVRLRPPEGDELNTLPTYSQPEQDLSVEIAEEVFVQEPFVTATGTNDGDYIGGTTVEIAVDGEVTGVANVRFPPNTTDGRYEFSRTIDDGGTYNVRVQTADGEPLAEETVTVRPPRTVAQFTDPTGDDNGPGGYTYPTNSAFPEGVFDLESFTIRRTPSLVEFTFEVETLNNAFGSGRGFSPHMFVLWVRDPSADGGSTTGLDDLGVNADFAAPWQYRLEVSGFTKSAVDATGAPLTDTTGATVTPRDAVDQQAGTVSLTVPADAFGGADVSELEFVAMVQSEDFGALRSVTVEAGGFTFGGAAPDAVGNAPLVMDLFTPEGTSQAEALAYDADSRATIPFVDVDAGAPQSPFQGALPGGDGPPTDPDGDGAFEDVNGDGQESILDVQSLLDNYDGDLTADQRAALDFNGDGNLTILDVVELLENF